MAPPKQQRRRRVSESSDDDESLPNAWEEMRRRLEPVSPAAAPSEESPEVIEIVDDTTPSKGGSPPFRVIDSVVEEEEPAPRPQPAPRPESPQPGPSGIQHQTDDDDDIVEERWFCTIDRNVSTLSSDKKDYDDLESAIATAITGFTAFADKFRAMGTLAYDYKEAYRACRKTLKRKREDCALAEAEVTREKRRFREAIDANEMLIKDLENEQRQAHDFKEQRDLAEVDVAELKTELAKAKSKAYRQKRYRAALKETLADKDATIARLEAELSQVRQHLHQFTRTTCPRGQRPGCSSWVEDVSTDEEET